MKDILDRIHRMTADDMLRRLQLAEESGEALSAAEWRAITDFLKHNGIELAKTPEEAETEKHPLPSLAQRLPFSKVAQEIGVSA